MQHLDGPLTGCDGTRLEFNNDLIRPFLKQNWLSSGSTFGGLPNNMPAVHPNAHIAFLNAS